MKKFAHGAGCLGSKAGVKRNVCAVLGVVVKVDFLRVNDIVFFHHNIFMPAMVGTEKNHVSVTGIDGVKNS